MDGDDISSNQVIERLIEMGFEHSAVTEAVKAKGSSLDDALEYVLNGPRRNSGGTSISSTCSTSNGKAVQKRALSSLHPSSQTRQSSILNHFQFTARPKRNRVDVLSDVLVLGSNVLPSCVEEPKDLSGIGRNFKSEVEPFLVDCPRELEIGSDWEKKVTSLLQKHFGYSSLKNFQKEALAAWLAHQDCLVLAATGSGKSLCFQIPALLTGKVVVVISPLISLMHDQCLKLAKHGVSACFLGSGQPDSTVEQKAMQGMYSIIYSCPETALRLIKPLQRLAESRGIALFAIDEVHCVSKWGHDFRPDYRRLSLLRENFSASSLKFLKFDIPLMALTATATTQVREDILKSLRMSRETKTVLTSFFRPNLRFLVKHSRTSSPSSYEKDFRELIDIYVRKRKSAGKKQTVISQELDDASDGSENGSISEADRSSPNDLDNIEDSYSGSDDEEVYAVKENGSIASKGKEMSVEYLENDVDIFQGVDDWDVAFGEFSGQSPPACWDLGGLSETIDPPNKPEERLRLLREPLEQGLTIIYVPTRKETLRITKYLCGFGVKAAAYNASLPKSHLRRVHKEFHENSLEVVVATIAFGMGIDKLNVRRIVHYGWPQSLEAYYQEAGRAGRDGKLAECTLYANQTRVPSLLPNKRNEDQTKKAYKMLSDCFRYGVNTSCCRAQTLVEYFGEDLREKCLLCDVCVDGPPEMQNLKEEADLLMQVIAAHYDKSSFMDGLYDDTMCTDIKQRRSTEMPNLRVLVSKIREQSQKFVATDLRWWQGLARIMEDKGYIREADNKIHVQIKFPAPTKLGLEFLQSSREQPFNVYPEADMLLSVSKPKSYSSFAEWGRGWADPEIRRQRLERMQVQPNRKLDGARGSRKQKRRAPRKSHGRKSNKQNPSSRTVRGRIEAKLSKYK
ncbi:ATP-dependent DNA helicase Q-like SIM [Corylus avellana]|uniref:ATP-dependent DNA helicase Q-like SIM n=1 Tax=Corylus avellana TaxID=13451 RepID=UPI00286CDE34|nr:ATP-dependent DNA helicase Q-like SIM [Corylus avellana]